MHGDTGWEGLAAAGLSNRESREARSQGSHPLADGHGFPGQRLRVGDSLFHDGLKQLLLIFSIKGGLRK